MSLARPASVEENPLDRVPTEAPEAEVTQESLVERDRQPTNRWYGVTAVALVAVGLGVVTVRPSLLLVAAVCAWYGAYYRLVGPPEPEIELVRRVDPPRTTPDESVTVTLAATNVGSRTIPDLRVVDGVPHALAVTEGTARLAAPLRPGERVSLTYELDARRGHHRFEPVTVIARDLAGAQEVTLEASVPSELHCEPEPHPLPPLPLRQLAHRVTGRVETDRPGAGVEFHSTREYRPGDPLNRIDWNRTARTGELTTLEFRREQAATVTVVVDVRQEAYVAPPDDETAAAERAADAAAALFEALLDAGDRVGIATVGADECWLAPGLGVDHRAAGRLLFAGHPSLGPKPPAGPVSVDYRRWQLEHRMPEDAQVVLVSPFADGGAERFATTLDARGHPVTAISPDPTGRETSGQLLARLERHLRLSRLRDRGVPVVDWDPSTPLERALEEASARW